MAHKSRPKTRQDDMYEVLNQLDSGLKNGSGRHRGKSVRRAHVEFIK